jgi:hypothetical protein
LFVYKYGETFFESCPAIPAEQQLSLKLRDFPRHRISIFTVAFDTVISLFKAKTNSKSTTMAASDQIRQMVNFILQEAHEKANEIRVKVGSDCLSTIALVP